MNKLFIIGLPRTGTTSISFELLHHDFQVAHTAFTKRTFELANVFSDTPCYCDYQQLDRLFPGSLFVYLDRDTKQWIPSIRMLLTKMEKNLRPEGHFNPIMKRCFNKTFELLSAPDPLTDAHLGHCYQQHKTDVMSYFNGRTDLLSINISHADSLNQLLTFLSLNNHSKKAFPHLNAGRMVTTWKDVKHPNKVNSNASGIERRKFLTYK